jgi:diphthine synthase
MVFYLISLGLDLNSISCEASNILKECNEIYLEGYTVDFPYDLKELEKSLNIKFKLLKREKVEDEEILKNASKKNIALLVYGDCLSATTHTQLIMKCKQDKIPFKIFHNSSILTAISNTGLQLYKFGKTASMPAWQKNFEPDSFVDLIKNNLSIDAHTLLLIDIGLSLEKSKEQLKISLKNKNLKVSKIILCSNIGIDKEKIYYDSLENFPKDVEKPYCFIIPAKLHFSEEEFLSSF